MPRAPRLDFPGALHHVIVRGIERRKTFVDDGGRGAGLRHDLQPPASRAGHLFQNYFKNILVDEEAYLLELVRYIHLNPVQSRLPVTVDSFPHPRI